MDRRGFLLRGALVVAGLGIEPDLLFWVPKPMITVPAMPQVTAKAFLEAMAEETISTIYYGSGAVYADEFTGYLVLNGKFTRIGKA